MGMSGGGVKVKLNADDMVTRLEGGPVEDSFEIGETVFIQMH